MSSDTSDGDTYRVLREDDGVGDDSLFEETPSLADMEELTRPEPLPPEALSPRETVPSSSADLLAQKAVFLLTIYPRLNATRLHLGLGPHIPPREWKPVLDRLIEDGVVKREIVNLQSPLGQFRSYTVISLTDPPPLPKPAGF